MALFKEQKEEHFLPATEHTDVVCKVLIGNGQSGSYLITLDADLLSADQPATLGKKADIEGKTTYVIAHVTDVLQETNWTSLSITLTEGTRETHFGPYNYQVPHQNDEVDFTIQIHHS